MQILVFVPRAMGMFNKVHRGIVKPLLYRNLMRPNPNGVGMEGQCGKKMFLVRIKMYRKVMFFNVHPSW